MSISVHPAITNGQPSKPSTKPGEKDKPETPEVQRLKTQQKRLDQESERLKKKIERARGVTAQDPNDDPMALYMQVQPLLSTLRFLQVQKSKTEIVVGQTRREAGKNHSLYKVLLDRKAIINPDNIEHLKRELESVDRIEWTNNGMCLYLWNVYEAPVGEAPAGRSAAQRVATKFLERLQ